MRAAAAIRLLGSQAILAGASPGVARDIALALVSTALRSVRNVEEALRLGLPARRA
ncbi:MAG: hypothetical protein ACREXU_17945 [Gammaproteobacteria bacterium]